MPLPINVLAPQTSTIFFNSCSFLVCDFIIIVLTLNSLFSSYNFCMNALTFYSFFILFFLKIYMLCLYSFWKSLSSSNFACNIILSLSSLTNMFLDYSPPN
jgi:hypothetical protein